MAPLAPVELALGHAGRLDPVVLRPWRDDDRAPVLRAWTDPDIVRWSTQQPSPDDVLEGHTRRSLCTPGGWVDEHLHARLEDESPGRAVG